MSAGDVVEPTWSERAAGRRWNAKQRRCIDTLLTIDRPYNLQLIGAGWRDVRTPLRGDDPQWDAPPVLAPLIVGDDFVTARLSGPQLSTYDMDELTRLWIAAHRNSVRVGLSARAHTIHETDDDGRSYEYVDACLEVNLHARRPAEPGMAFWERHPTIEQVIA